ncbi:MAG: sugar phosphate isomerase/epimerase [Lachnospiraceae bacterium]|nr:sugar phosphate isomerase/epimerase [Lachnospiraceae bacterium]
MKVGLCVNFNGMEAMEEKLQSLRAENFSSCQLLAWRPDLWTDENAVILRELFAKYEVEISAFWCGWEGPAVWNFYEGPTTLGLVPAEYRQMRVKNLIDGADFAKKLGVTDVVTHMGFIPENPNDPVFVPFCDAIRQVAKHLEANGQYLLFETGQETPVAMLRCFETVGTQNLGVNLDTANLILYGKANPVDALDVFGKYVRNLHAKDGKYPTNGHDLGCEVRLGDGKVDFYALFKKLHELGYDSHVTIEREIDGEQQILDIRYAKKYLEDTIGEIYGA